MYFALPSPAMHQRGGDGVRLLAATAAFALLQLSCCVAAVLHQALTPEALTGLQQEPSSPFSGASVPPWEADRRRLYAADAGTLCDAFGVMPSMCHQWTIDLAPPGGAKSEARLFSTSARMLLRLVFTSGPPGPRTRCGASISKDLRIAAEYRACLTIDVVKVSLPQSMPTMLGMASMAFRWTMSSMQQL